MLKKTLILGMFALTAAFGSAYSQQTGSFDTTIKFAGTDRTLSCYAPTDYDKPSLVVSLHGAGDNSINMRDVLIEQMKWQEIMPNTVFIFPDGATVTKDPNDPARDFYTPAGDEAIIDSVIAWAKAQYGIDETRIILHGFSLGGRSALKWGLDNPTKIAGLVLNTPAVQSPMDVHKDKGYSLNYNYSNASKLRMSISLGESDGGFINTVNMLADSLVANNARLFFIQIPQMAHAITPNEITGAMVEYLFTESTKSRAELYKFDTEPFYNSNIVTPKALVRNIGFAPIDSLIIDYTVNGTAKQKSWVGKLNVGEHAYIDLAEETLPLGYNEIKGFISKYDTTNYPKTQIINDQSASFQVFAPAKAIPYEDDFSDLNQLDINWSIKPSGNYISWAPPSYLFSSEVKAVAMLNTQFAYQNFGLTESLYSNVFDFSKAKKPTLSFNVAFNYSHYTSAVFTNMPNGIDFTDTLEIFISKDNGATFTSLHKLWGEQLRTFKTVLTDPMSTNPFLVVPADDEWKGLQYNLADNDVSDKTQFRFDYISGSGGVIYLTDFKFFDDDNNSVTDRKVNDFNVYPNPTNSVINLPQFLIEATNSIEIFNALGTKVLSQSANALINIESLVNGIYTIKIGNNTSSFVVAK